MKTPLIILSIILICGIIITLTACTNHKSSNYYSVDYCGQKHCYSGAKDKYKAGSKVTLYYELIATDTDYQFTLDGENINCTYDEQKGFVIEFIMPEHDVVLECHWKNSMTPYLTE